MGNPRRSGFSRKSAKGIRRLWGRSVTAKLRDLHPLAALPPPRPETAATTELEETQVSKALKSFPVTSATAQAECELITTLVSPINLRAGEGISVKSREPREPGSFRAPAPLSTHSGCQPAPRK